MSKKGRPATYRDARHALSQRFLLRESFDDLLEQSGAVELIASLWATHQLLLRRKLVEKGASDQPTPEDFKRMEAARDYIRQRLPDRLYYAAVLTVMEALPAGLGQDVPVTVIEQWEKLTAIAGRKNEWLPRKGRRRGAKAGRSSAADAAQEEARRNQVLGAIGELSRELPEYKPITQKAIAKKIGKTARQLRRWGEIYEWDWVVMDFEGKSGHEKEK